MADDGPGQLTIGAATLGVPAIEARVEGNEGQRDQDSHPQSDI